MLQKTLIFVLLATCSFTSCKMNEKFIIKSGVYFISDKIPKDILGMKINSEKELKDYIDKCPVEKVKSYLKGMNNINFNKSFIYITTNSELQSIKNVSWVNVKPAFLKDAQQQGIGIYIIEGNPDAIIKPTDAVQCKEQRVNVEDNGK